MAKYDVHRVFERIPVIMGMDLTRLGQRWVGGYYINGEHHHFRKDKIKVIKWHNDIWVHEEGGESMSLCNWLMAYGGAADFGAALNIVKGHQSPIKFDESFRRKQKRGLIVPDGDYEGLAQYDLKRCNLFNWMCSLFGEEKVRDAWQKYRVTTDAHGNAVFWFVDDQNRILHDKRMAYLPNGHRNREYGAWRKYTISKGYDGKCFFGDHLWNNSEKVYVCESEKTALLFFLYYGKPIIATGGKKALGGSCDRFILVPDMDAREEWASKGDVWEWWKNFDNIGDHDDIGDAIVRRISYISK